MQGVVGNEPGLVFSPSDEDLIDHYLRRRTTQTQGISTSALLIKDFDVYSVNPWDLPRDFFGYRDESSDIYFFTCRRPTMHCAMRANRSAGDGFWDGNSTSKPVYKKLVAGDPDSCQDQAVIIGHKTPLNFKIRRGEAKIKTEWIMNEYRLHHHHDKSDNFDRMVVCKIHLKKSSSNVVKRCRAEEEEEAEAEQMAAESSKKKRMRVEEEEIVPVTAPPNFDADSSAEPSSSAAASSIAAQAEAPEVASAADWFPEDLFDDINESLLCFLDSDTQPSLDEILDDFS